MRSIKISLLFLAICLILLNSSCTKDPALAPKTPTVSLQSLVPFYFPPVNYSNPSNPFSKKGVALGRKLFYDPILSSTNTISCGSCHKQEFAFSDAGNTLSEGVHGLLGNRNSPAMFNLAWQPHYMWDGGITNLEIMPFAPITDAREMNQDVKLLLEELKNDLEYPQEFVDVFGADGITEVNFFYALTQFMGTMISANAKYDKVQKGEIKFSPEEAKGYALFKSKCNSCHTEPLFSNHQFENNGLTVSYPDSGRGRVTALPGDMGKFKIPSLRNVALTYPYMHDGSINSLEKVLEHYSSGIATHPNLNKSLEGGLQLSQEEQQSIISFLNTLTDFDFIQNPELAAP